MLGSAAGFDFSAGKVRAVEIRKGLRRTEIRRASLDPSGLGAFVREELSPGATTVTGISSSPLFMRVLDFPFRDSKKIRKVYRFELENASGFGAEEDGVHDFHEVRGPSGDGGHSSGLSEKRLRGVSGLDQGSGARPRVRRVLSGRLFFP